MQVQESNQRQSQEGGKIKKEEDEGEEGDEESECSSEKQVQAEKSLLYGCTCVCCVYICVNLLTA